MAITIAVSGKGGTGKTSITCLILRHLINNGAGPILAIDADPNNTLNENLRIDAEITIGDIREKQMEEKGLGPAGVPKGRMLEYEVEECLIEHDDFDLLVMGRQEGPGCYCYINNILREYIMKLSSSYKFVLLDNEAGMEHLSRRTTNNIDVLLLVSEADPVSLKSAVNIASLADKLKLNIGSKHLIVNKVTDKMLPVVEEKVAETSIPLLGTIPYDRLLVEHVLNEESLLTLPETSGAVQAVKQIFDKLELINAGVQ
jgi:CO dehydrogenase maturation factor